jgi:hypothetical protein
MNSPAPLRPDNRFFHLKFFGSGEQPARMTRIRSEEVSVFIVFSRIRWNRREETRFARSKSDLKPAALEPPRLPLPH